VASATVEEAVADIHASFAGDYGDLWSPATLAIYHRGEPVAAVLTVRRAPWGDTPDCPVVIELLTALAFRRRGLARLLIARYLAATADAAEPALSFRIDAGNRSARRLYATLGFRDWSPGTP
jgi:GNAT superfamily N-acetyltransferase